MQFFRLLLFVVLCPAVLSAQNVGITGKVVRSDNDQPVVQAIVFLGNSSLGTSTLNDGTFTINGLRPGQYTLVVAALGYENNTQVISVNDKPIDVKIALLPKLISNKSDKQKATVAAMSKSQLKSASAEFNLDFIGTDANSRDCKIINPEVLHFLLYKNQSVLEASTDEFLIIENSALGYKVKFLLKDFKEDKAKGTISYSGQQLFEELPGTIQQKKKWDKKRDEAYYGSSMHFFRSLYKDSLTEQGFHVYELMRLNSKTPPFYTDTLSEKQWAASEIVKKTAQPNVLTLTFPHFLYIVYTKSREKEISEDIYRTRAMKNYPVSIVKFTGSNRYTFFDANGIIVGPAPLFEGYWSKSRLSELLPIDYTPISKK